MFEYFMDRFSRPLSQQGTRQTAARARPTGGQRTEGSRRASSWIPSGLAPRPKSQGSFLNVASSGELSAFSQSVLLSSTAPLDGLDYGGSTALGGVRSQHSMPELAVSSNTSGRSRGMGVTGGGPVSEGSGSERGSGESAGSGSARARERGAAQAAEVVAKVAALESHQVTQRRKLEAARAENLRLQREMQAASRATAGSTNEIERLGVEVAQLTQELVESEAKLLAAGEEPADGGRGSKRRQKEAEFNRLRDMYASENLKTPEPKAYDPWASTTVTTEEATDSMLDVVGKVRAFLSTVESEQFVTRQMRNEVDDFVEALGEMGQRTGETWELQHADGTWAKLGVDDALRLREERDGGDGDSSPGGHRSYSKLVTVKPETAAGRHTYYDVDLGKMQARRAAPRNLRARERSESDRAASVLALFAMVQMRTPRAQRSRPSTPGFDGRPLSTSGRPHADTQASVVAAPGTHGAVFAAMEDRLSAGVVQMVGQVFQFNIEVSPAEGAEGEAMEASRPTVIEYTVDLNESPGAVHRTEAGGRQPEQTFVLQELELLRLFADLGRPSQSAAAAVSSGLLEGFVPAAPVRPASSGKGKKAKGKGKGKGKGKKGAGAEVVPQAVGAKMVRHPPALALCHTATPHSQTWSPRHIS
jgi:hypothetical protein